ncbi:MAG TPA: archease [Thermoanaerobaculia bacterium]|nr:archease [Thermoanaerobaculia bacterium]
MHRLLGHTADLRAELSAPDFATLCAEAVDLVREVLVGPSEVVAREERRVHLEGEEEAERFFRFVRELIYLADVDGFLPSTCSPDDGAVIVSGEPFDPLRHQSERQVKALTRHRYLYERTTEGLRAELIFDL